MFFFSTCYPVISILFIKKTIVASVTWDTPLSPVAVDLFLDFLFHWHLRVCMCYRCFNQRNFLMWFDISCLFFFIVFLSVCVCSFLHLNFIKNECKPIVEKLIVTWGDALDVHITFPTFPSLTRNTFVSAIFLCAAPPIYRQLLHNGPTIWCCFPYFIMNPSYGVIFLRRSVVFWGE